MEKIASFTIDHLKLVPGVYVSRKDTIGKEVITTFDLRMTRPKYIPLNIWLLLFYATIRFTVIKPFTLDQWAAAQAFTCCWPVT